jgi:hypothetical protein
MNPDYIIAIDPGCSGAAAVIDPTTREIEEIRPFISPRDLSSFFSDWARVSPNITVVIEKIHPSPVQGPSSAGAMMLNYGYWIMAALAYLPRSELREVTPQEWQKPFKLTSKGSERKRDLKALAQAIYSDGRVTLTNCDAILLAHAACDRLSMGKLHG